jgi:hypothetical protein
VGSAAPIGHWDPAQALRMTWTVGDVWWGDFHILPGWVTEMGIACWYLVDAINLVPIVHPREAVQLRNQPAPPSSSTLPASSLVGFSMQAMLVATMIVEQQPTQLRQLTPCCQHSIMGPLAGGGVAFGIRPTWWCGN